MANIILLHGAIGSSKQMEKVADLLSKENTVYNFSFPGHGDEKMPESFSIHSFTEFIQQKINNIEGDVHILGYSLGGYTALLLAKKLPEKVKSVMTFATIFDWNKAQSEKQIVQINPEKIKTKVPAFAEHLKNIHGEKWEEVLYRTHDLLNLLGENPVHTSESLNSLSQRIHISVGDRDPIVSIEETVVTYKSIRNSSLSIYPNTGHPFEKAPVEKIASDFLELVK